VFTNLGRTVAALVGVCALAGLVVLVARSQRATPFEVPGTSLTERRVTVVLNAVIGSDGTCSPPPTTVDRQPLPSMLDPLDPVGACYQFAEVDGRNRIRWSFTAMVRPDGTVEVPGVVQLRDGTAVLVNGAVFAAEPDGIEVRCGTEDDRPELADVVDDRLVLHSYVDPATLRITAVSCALNGS
jgi:hypothetical protein